ncbi:MAG: EMC3/TMCO1 family protein [Candidatus Bathyarchaeia archaeon]|nr:DUF106 domain-containing protein [Candidatus Bathyarchaeota archaeon]
MVLDLLSIPNSTFFIMFIAFVSSLITTLLNRKFVDRRLLAEWQDEIAKWSAERELAKKTGDKKLMAKVKKQELRIMQIRSKISSQQMKTSLITFIPFLLIWWILISFYGNVPVALLPVWGELGLPFFIWYIICQFFFSYLLSKIFNVEMGYGVR